MFARHSDSSVLLCRTLSDQPAKIIVARPAKVIVALYATRAGDIEVLCRKHYVVNLALFGSATTDNFKEGSDLDFLVTFPDGLSARQKAAAFFGLKQDLEAMFERPVDLITQASLTNPYFKQSVMAGQRTLYAA